MEIHFASTSERKFKRLERGLGPYGIEVVWHEMELPEPPGDLRSIAEGKASAAYEKIRKSCMALDTGFYVDSLDGEPGPLVRRTLEKTRAEGILERVEGKSRTCRFTHCYAYRDEEGGECFTVEAPGTLSYSLRGEPSKWELHKVFIPDGWDKTIAEMTPQEYTGYEEQGYRNFFKCVADWIKERNDWLDH